MAFILIALIVIIYIAIGQFVYGFVMNEGPEDILEEIIITMIWPLVLFFICIFTIAFVFDKIFPNGPFGFMKDLGKKLGDVIHEKTKR